MGGHRDCWVMDSMPFLRVDLGPVGLWGGPGKWGVSKKSELALTLVFLSFCSRHVLRQFPLYHHGKSSRFLYPVFCFLF